MKRIIKNKRYDTEKATEMASYQNIANVRDFNWWKETLYQKKTGEFFLHGIGGPKTRYAERVDVNSWSGGERLMPMTYDEAKNWAEEYLDADEYESIFGEVTEDDSKKSITFKLTTKSLDILKRHASKTGRTQSEIIEDLITTLK